MTRYSFDKLKKGPSIAATMLGYQDLGPIKGVLYIPPDDYVPQPRDLVNAYNSQGQEDKDRVIMYLSNSTTSDNQKPNRSFMENFVFSHKHFKDNKY